MATMDAASFSNEFGQVYRDRVCFNVRKGLLSGSSREELAVRHITSVRSEVDRNVGLALVLGVVAGICFSGGSSGGAFLGLLLLGLAALAFIGKPTVTINTAGGDRRSSSGGRFQQKAAEAFAGAVSRAMFSER